MAFDHNPRPHRRLKRGMQGKDVEKFIAGLKKQLRRYGRKKQIKTTDTVTPGVVDAYNIVRHDLGLPDNHPMTVGAQLNVRRPWTRSAAALARARRRRNPQRRALAFLRKHWGMTENPPGSNRGPIITEWQRFFGEWLVGAPWCGVGSGRALVHAGVKGITYRVASVAFIEDDARAGRNGFKRWLGRHDGAKRGMLVVVGGRGVHVETVRYVTPLGVLTTGCNTSSGTSGSQSDGGGCFPRFRFWSEIYGFAEPDWASAK